MIGLINYGAGNFTSVYNALKFLGAQVRAVTRPEDFEDASHLILPGVGAFIAAMRKLKELGLMAPLQQAALEKRKHFLGICVGMQILAEVGFEDGTHEGLGWITGEACKVDTQASRLPLPHIGWNEVKVTPDCPLFRGLGNHPVFYFVHSYHVRCKDRANVVATCDYGVPVTAAVQNGNIFGVQFHPEKSQSDGLNLLKNFISL